MEGNIGLKRVGAGGGLEPPRREALTPEASVSTNSTTAATQFVSVNEVWCRGGTRTPTP